MAFAGGSAFDIGGVPVAGGTAVIEAGLDFNVSRNATLDLSNSGQFECGLNDQPLRGDFACNSKDTTMHVARENT